MPYWLTDDGTFDDAPDPEPFSYENETEDEDEDTAE